MNLKHLSKELVLAIDWAAAEYKYLEDLKAELKKVEWGSGNQYLSEGIGGVNLVIYSEKIAKISECIPKYL